ncbi:MAG TPA: PPK2 family polyphosphate kinase [Candidatus Limnocylindrales bacterium]|jgi:PPK2 family polyphosphate:nucleotide phosphotransferase
MPGATIIDGNRHVPLGDVDPATDGGITRADAERRLGPLAAELRELQELMFAAESNGVLVVLQGMDAAGKDVTIRTVFAAATPEAIRVRHFKPMTDEEEAHDFLWRAHAATPARGELVIFDRSYYEQLVLPEVEGTTTREQSAERAEDVRAFERMLRHGGTIVVKFFLHVSREEQERRLSQRMHEPDTAWKISARDWIARDAWDAYMAAYETTMNATATPEAPWHVVPADREWVYNLIVADTLVGRLRPYREAWIAARRQRGEKKAAEAREVAPEHVSC